MDKEKQLKKYRNDIDRIDDQILSLLLQRFEVVHAVGELKNLKNSRESIIRPDREYLMIKSILKKLEERKKSLSFDLDKKIIRNIFRNFIAASINIEEDVRIGIFKFSELTETLICSCNYFGAFSEYQIYENSSELFEDLKNAKISTVIMPLILDKKTIGFWKNFLKNKEELPKIFSKISDELVAISFTSPKETGEDESIFICERKNAKYSVISEFDILSIVKTDSFVQEIDEGFYLGSYGKNIF